jgi:plastocyanin
LKRWTGSNADPQSPKYLTGLISAGGFYIVCNDADKFAAAWPSLTCDQDIGTGGPADGNGDDQLGLYDSTDSVVDFLGQIGQDGSGKWHEFEDGRAERTADVITGCLDTTGVACESGWVVDNDSGGGDGNQFAPEGFDPMSWIGAGEAPSDVYGCMDIFGLNFNADATVDDGGCEYATHIVEAGNMYFSPADISINMGESVQWNNVQGYHDVVADDGSFSLDGCSGPCLIGSHTFDVAGTYSYVCSPHTSMRGTNIAISSSNIKCMTAN